MLVIKSKVISGLVHIRQWLVQAIGNTFLYLLFQGMIDHIQQIVGRVRESYKYRHRLQQHALTPVRVHVTVQQSALFTSRQQGCQVRLGLDWLGGFYGNPARQHLMMLLVFNAHGRILGCNTLCWSLRITLYDYAQLHSTLTAFRSPCSTTVAILSSLETANLPI